MLDPNRTPAGSEGDLDPAPAAAPVPIPDDCGLLPFDAPRAPDAPGLRRLDIPLIVAAGTVGEESDSNA